jgi:hypothetical protein
MEMRKNYLMAATNLKIEGIVNGMCVAVFVSIYLAYILNDFIMFTDINSGDENEIITALHAVKILTEKCNLLGSKIMNPDYSNVIPKLVQSLSSVDKYVVSLTCFPNISS